MKKVTRILTSFVLCLSLCLSMAACGSKEASSDGNNSALEEYISENQAQIDEMSSAMEGQGNRSLLKLEVIHLLMYISSLLM